MFDNRLAKIAEVKSKLSSAGLREQLKSTGQSKYALDEKEEGVRGRLLAVTMFIYYSGGA